MISDPGPTSLTWYGYLHALQVRTEFAKICRNSPQPGAVDFEVGQSEGPVQVWKLMCLAGLGDDPVDKILI